MATNKYSLADYQISVTLPSGGNAQALLERSGLQNDSPIFIGGAGENGLDGSFVGTISISRSKEVWSTEGDSTGSWVHNKNLDRTGEIKVDITQVSDQIITLAMICNAYQNLQETVGGLLLTVRNAYDSSLPPIAVAYDCYIKKVPDQDFGDSAKQQSFVFTCGRIMIYDN